MFSGHWLPRISLIKFAVEKNKFAVKIATLLFHKGYSNALVEMYTSVRTTIKQNMKIQ